MTAKKGEDLSPHQKAWGNTVAERDGEERCLLHMACLCAPKSLQLWLCAQDEANKVS